MTPGDTALSPQQHIEAAHRHLAAARELASVSGEWAVVAAFYSAYHHMRAAIYSDPIWDQGPTALSEIDKHLQMDCRTASHHQGNAKTGRSMGVTDIARKLYPAHGNQYRILHGASITCRYGSGVGSLLRPPEEYIDLAEKISSAADDGLLSTAHR